MSTTAKRILITGADTSLGRAVIDELLQDPGVAHVLALHPDEGGLASAAPHAKVTHRHADLRHAREASRFLLGEAFELGIDSVVHDLVHPTFGADATRKLVQLCEEQSAIRHLVLRSTIDVYRVSSRQPSLIDETHVLELGARAEVHRHLVESDLYACSRMSESPLTLQVLRCADMLAPDVGSTLYDYLRAPLCLRPFGFDPMLNALTTADAAHAVVLALRHERSGIFNVPGLDTLPLSELIFHAERRSLPIAESLLSPLYKLRAKVADTRFRYDSMRARFHHGGVLDGRHAADVLGYEPRHGVDFSALASALK